MKFQHKLILLILVIVAVLLTPFFLWHDEMDAYFASEEYALWLESIRPFAWLIGIGLIVGDLVLPVPATAIISALGTLYGAWWGGLIGGVGLMLAGMVAYGLARLFGARGARLLASDAEMAEFRRFFDTWGAVGIIGSRALPVMPEVLTLLAGLARMHFGRFVAALAIGSMPVGLFLAWVGEAAGQSSTLLLVMTLIPAGLWCLYLLVSARRADGVEVEEVSPRVEPAVD